MGKVREFYTLCVKVREDLPLIELPGEYASREEAEAAAERFRMKLEIRVSKNTVRE